MRKHPSISRTNFSPFKLSFPFSLLVEPLFEALSQCASLHPSGNEEDDSGNPFASIGAFGTGNYSGAYGEQEEGTFDDAEADDGEATEGLTEGGRVRNDFQTPDSRFKPY